MANLTEQTPAVYPAGIYQLETSDPVIGGPEGISNQQAKQLADRTKYLKEHVDALENGTGIQNGSITAAKLAAGVIPSTYRSCILKGHADANGANAIVTRVNATTIAINSSPIAAALSFAWGWDSLGQRDFFAEYSSDINLTLAGEGVANGISDVFVFMDRNTLNGVITPRMDTGPFIISAVEPGVGNRKYWFDLVTMVWKEWNSGLSAWSLRQYVLLARVTRNQSQELNVVYNYPFRESLDPETGIVPGTIVSMHRDHTSPPNGWLHCNGANVSRTTYARLFAIIGTSYGAGDGSTTFKLPDLRGEFIRGLDAGRNVDAGRTLGASQADELKSHTHTDTFNHRTSGQGEMIGNTTPLTGIPTSNVTQITVTSDATGGAETRPRNVAYPFFIKF
jgi:microcystin-dependent protein